MKIVIGVTGSIAAYKIADVINMLKVKHEIKVVMTKNASKIISAETLKVLSGNKVYTQLFDEEEINVSHIELAQEADLILVAPASANFISKINSGICDDLLSTILIASDLNKVVLAPAMNTNMYNNPIIKNNLNSLKSLGVSIIEPKEALLACNVYGKGALASIETIVDYVNNYDIN